MNVTIFGVEQGLFFLPKRVLTMLSIVYVGFSGHLARGI